MVDIKRDIYTLGQSEKGILHSPGEEIRIDLKLKLDATDTIGGTVYGVVEDSFTSAPIPGALVKVMSTDYNPLKHAITDSLGNYIINNVPVEDTFKIYAIAQGKSLKESTIISGTLAEKIKMDFTLEDDEAMKKAVVAGDVFNSANVSEPIGGAVVSLYLINGSSQSLKAVTDTNQYGQFTFREVELGQYSITITSDGYYHQEVSINATTQGQIIPIKIGLNQNPSNSKGTVSGVIRNELGNPISRGDVILYEVNENEDGSNETLTPVAYTKTNDEGVYLFSNVKQAKYKIKSNESKIIKIVSPNSPDFYGFTVANATVLTPKVVSIFEARAYDGAIKVLDDNFIASLGGSSTSPGWMEISITPPFPGEFNFSIKYLSGREDTTILLKRDSGGDDEEFIIDFPKTNGWEEKDSKVKTIKLAMHPGQNTFKIYAETDKPAPWIGDFSIVYVKHATIKKSALDATVKNLASITGSFITGIGGISNGEASVTFNIPFSQPYQLSFKSLAADEPRLLKIDVDGENQDSMTVPRTTTWTEVDAKIQKVEVYAEEGEREFRFYNDTNQYGPHIGYFTLDEYVIHEKILPSQVTILGTGEKFKTDETGVEYITGIVQGDGEIKMVVEAFETQLHDFKILYKCDEERVCNVKIKYEDEDYEVEAKPFSPIKFLPTEGEVRPIYSTLFLHQGENIITIYND